MTTRPLHAALVLVAMLWLFANSASAMLHPQQGRFMQRDPLGYMDGMGLYEYVRSRPLNWVDSSGNEACVCGPEVTDALIGLLQRTVLWRHRLRANGVKPGWAWARGIGMSFDWRNETLDGVCPQGKKCMYTQTLCGECVQDSWIGNFMYALVLRMADSEEPTIRMAGGRVQGPGPGDPPRTSYRVYADSPWDRAGYELAFLFLNALDDPSAPSLLDSSSFCALMKSSELWAKSKDVSMGGSMAHRGHSSYSLYPTPRQDKRYQECEPCLHGVNSLHGLPAHDGVPEI